MRAIAIWECCNQQRSGSDESSLSRMIKRMNQLWSDFDEESYISDGSVNSRESERDFRQKNQEIYCAINSRASSRESHSRFFSSFLVGAPIERMAVMATIAVDDSFAQWQWQQ